MEKGLLCCCYFIVPLFRFYCCCCWHYCGCERRRRWRCDANATIQQHIRLPSAYGPGRIAQRLRDESSTSLLVSDLVGLHIDSTTVIQSTHCPEKCLIGLSLGGVDRTDLHCPAAPPALGPKTCCPTAIRSGFTRPYPPGSSHVVIPASRKIPPRTKKGTAAVRTERFFFGDGGGRNHTGNNSRGWRGRQLRLDRAVCSYLRHSGDAQDGKCRFWFLANLGRTARKYVAEEGTTVGLGT